MSADRSLVLGERTSSEGLDVLLEPVVTTTGGPVLGADPAVRSALLVLERGPGAGTRFLLNRETTLIGRSDSDIVLDGVTVSRRHAEIRRDGPSFVVVDVGSFNGIYLNRSPVDTAVLADGDEVQVGKFRLIFHSAPPGAVSDDTGAFVAAESSAAARGPA